MPLKLAAVRNPKVLGRRRRSRGRKVFDAGAVVGALKESFALG
jgi:hypothetical protein